MCGLVEGGGRAGRASRPGWAPGADWSRPGGLTTGDATWERGTERGVSFPP